MEAFDQTFRESVRRQSDVDVEFGAFLSGGLDSSLVSAVTRSLHPSRALKAYTLRFRETSFDEWSFAESVARQLNMEQVSVWVRPQPEVEFLCLMRLGTVRRDQRVMGCYLEDSHTIVSVADPYVLLHEFKHHFEGKFHE